MTGQASHERIAVSLVTGFLGSGKTTLIAALLKQPAMAGTAVIVNEFGAVGIDDAIFAQSRCRRQCPAPRQWMPLLHRRRRPFGAVWSLARRDRRPPAADRHRDHRPRRPDARAAAADERPAADAGDTARCGRRHHRRGERAQESRRPPGRRAPVRGRRPPHHHQGRSRRGRSRRRARRAASGAQSGRRYSRSRAWAHRCRRAFRRLALRSGADGKPDIDRWLGLAAPP